jgi:hypothetical protein
MGGLAKLRRRRTRNLDRGLGAGMAKDEGLGMEPIATVAGQGDRLGISGGLRRDQGQSRLSTDSIERVAHKGKSGGGSVNPNLVGTARENGDFDQHLVMISS